jgi:hypothetical protein
MDSHLGFRPSQTQRHQIQPGDYLIDLAHDFESGLLEAVENKSIKEPFEQIDQNLIIILWVR